MNQLSDNKTPLTISIDDVNPKKNWRILGDETEKYLLSLHQEFGVKFTLFIPANHHGDAKLSDNKSWIKEISSIPFVELAAHGYFHRTSNSSLYGEMEFYDIGPDECESRFTMINNEWQSVEIKPNGWRNPGWICQPYCKQHIESHFEWVALHYEHNQNMLWKIKTFFGADSIEHKPTSKHNGIFMLQSHIFGDWNSNSWNQKNYERIRASIISLLQEYNLQFSTISEVL